MSALQLSFGPGDTPQGNLPAVNGVSRYGFNGNGSANNWSCWQAALSDLASGGTLYLPAGTYNFNTPDGNGVVLPSNFQIYGDGISTVISPQSSSAASKFPFVVNGDNISLHDFKVLSGVTGSAPGNGAVFLVNGNRSRFANLYIDGTGSPTNQNIIHGFMLNNAFTDLYIDRCTLTNLRYGLLKNNTNTNAHTLIRVRNSYFLTNYANDLAFNGPEGQIADVLVEGNRFENNQGGPTYGTFGIMCGMASVLDYRVIANHFEGTCVEAIHLEQAGNRIVVTGNTGNITGSAITLLDNNVGGTDQGNQHVVISNNTFVGPGLATTLRGIWSENTGDAVDSASYKTFVGNVIDGFQYGIFDQSSRNSVISGNFIRSCGTAIGGVRAVATIANNTMRDCNGSYSFSYGGILGKNTLQNNTTIFGSATTSGKLCQSGFSIFLSNVSAVSGSNSITLFPIGSLLKGRLSISFINETSNFYGNLSADVLYDGTTFTPSGQVAASTSQFTIGALSVASGSVKLALTNTTGSTISLTFMYIDFEGLYEG